MLGTDGVVNLDGAPERPASSDPRLVLPLLQSLGLIAACAGLVVLLLGLQALSGDPQFRRDLRGAASLFLGYLVLRTVDLYRGAQLAVGLHQVLELAWMLALTFGFIRLGVSLLLKIAGCGAGRRRKSSRRAGRHAVPHRDADYRPARVPHRLLQPAGRVGHRLGGHRPRAPGDPGEPVRRPGHPARTALPGRRHHLGGERNLRPRRPDWLARHPGREQAPGGHLPAEHHLQQAGGEELLERHRAGGIRHLRRAHLRHAAQPREGGHPRDPGGGALVLAEPTARIRTWAYESSGSSTASAATSTT